MAGMSKPAEDEAEAARKRSQLKLVMLHCTINMTVSILNFHTRGELLKNLPKAGGELHSYDDVARYMAMWTSATAAIEFLVNVRSHPPAQPLARYAAATAQHCPTVLPWLTRAARLRRPQPTIGRLADTFGRKPFMIMAPYAAIVLKILVLLKPSVLMLTVERIVCDLLRVISGTTMGQVAINDLVPREGLSVAYAQQQAYTAIGILGAPLIGSLMSAEGTYYAAIALAAVQLASDQFMLKETSVLLIRPLFYPLFTENSRVLVTFG